MKTICSYDEWCITVNDDGTLTCHDQDNSRDIPVVEVYRLEPGAYETKDIADLEAACHAAGHHFDCCGELDDCSAYCFWKQNRMPARGHPRALK